MFYLTRLFTFLEKEQLCFVTRVFYARKQDKEIQPARISQLKYYKNMTTPFPQTQNIKNGKTARPTHLASRYNK